MTLVDARVPTRAPGIELLGELRDAGYTDTRCMVRRADGQLVQLTSLLYQLVDAVDGQRDVLQLAEEVSRRCGKAVTPENIEFLLGQKLEPLGLVCDKDGGAPEARKPVPLLALRWKVVITDPAVTRRITAPFTGLFKPWVVVPVLLAFAVTCWWVLFEHGLASGIRQAFDTPQLLLAAFGLILVSAGWHEFGHAAACQASGATPGAMGAGVYMVWPAFYTDVDDCRRLDRWGRLKVDLGGLYFNAVAAVAVMAVWLPTRVDALLLVVAAQLLMMVRQLAPVIRADGYHILSDLVGVPDLFMHVKPTLQGMLPTNWRKPQPLRRGPRWVVRLWVFTVMPLLLWLFLGAVLLMPRLVATAWMGLTEQAQAIASSGGNVLGVLAGLLKMASLVLPIAAGAYMLGRFGQKAHRSVWKRTEGRPVARSVVAGLTALLVLFLAFAWWPKGQYQPVSATEGGTLLHAIEMSNPQRTSASAPIPGVKPVSGYALVPRDGEGASMLLVPAEDGGLTAIITEGDRAGVAFPFTLPDTPRPGVDNQALAVNTADGSTVYDVSVALVWVTDGEVADSRNEAYALASCTGCTTVAVAFQVVLVVGQTDVVAPVNVAVALNSACIGCQTSALAVQLVLTLSEMPSEELQARINEALGRLDDIDVDDLDTLYAEIQAVQQEIYTLLNDAGLVEGVPAPAESGTTAPTTTTTAGPTTTTTTTTTDAGTDATTTTTTSESPTTTTTEPPASTTTTAPEAAESSSSS